MLTAQEQYFLELVNTARLDPQAEAARQGIGLNVGLEPGTIGPDAVQPLAANPLLSQAAADHSQWMLANDVFSHTGEGGSDPGDRMADVGFVFDGAWSWGENLAWSGTTGTLDPDAAIDTHHDGLFASPGHRENLFAAQFRETGIGQETGTFFAQGQDWNASMLTHKFAKSGSEVFLTGVVYSDADGDGAYSIGEGTDGLAITAAGQSVLSAAAGGYNLGLAPGTAVQVTLGSDVAQMEVAVDLTAGNVKLDVVDGVIATSGNVTLGDGATDVQILGAMDTAVTGNAANNTVRIGHGDNLIDGGAGRDTVVFSGNQADFEIYMPTDDVWSVTDLRGGAFSDGWNQLSGVEVLQFADGARVLAPADLQLAGAVQDPAGNPAAGMPLRFVAETGEVHDGAVGPDGGFAFTLAAGTQGTLTAAAPVDTSGIGVIDALDVLRLGVGLEPTFGPATPFDLIAADVDRNGDIGVQDALHVLRAAVGLDAPGAGETVLIDPMQPLDELTPNSVTYQSGVDLAGLDSDLSLSLNAVVLGDLGVTQAV